MNKHNQTTQKAERTKNRQPTHCKSMVMLDPGFFLRGGGGVNDSKMVQKNLYVVVKYATKWKAPAFFTYTCKDIYT